MKTQWLACLALALGACPSATVDPDEVGGNPPTVEFDPSNRIIPFPNNLLLDPSTGKLNLPEQCNETPASAATRVGVLNTLDGFGTYQPAINVTFSEAVDAASLQGRVLVFKRADGAEGTDPLTAIPIPVVAIPGMTQRFTDQADIKNCTDPQPVVQVTFVPLQPLDQKSTYTVALLSGIQTAGGDDFGPSFVWSLVREPEPVVLFDEAGNVTLNRTPLDPAADIATLQGIDLLWNAHRGAMTFLAGAGNDATDVLLAWDFNTQTVSDPLDPTVEGSPASGLLAAPLAGVQNPAQLTIGRQGPFAPCATDTDGDPGDLQCFLRVTLGGGNPNVNLNYAIGKATCAAARCDQIGAIRVGGTLSKQYLAALPNTLYTGTGSKDIPGAWSDPLNPTVVHDPMALPTPSQAVLETLVLLPTTPAPPDGYPTVIFQHGITRSKGDVFAMAGNLAANGYAVVAIDAALHGTRAVRISNAANALPPLDCVDFINPPYAPRPDRGPDPTVKPSCYAPIFSSDLAATRDGFRQSILDLQQLVSTLRACGTTNCDPIEVDGDQIFYVGQSLGGIYGSMATGLDSRIKASVLNVAGVGWVDILENTKQTVAFQCPLVDALIDAGFLSGDKFDPIAGTGLCLTDAWKTDPGYRQFAVIGRWVLDAADPANYTRKLAPSTFLLQRVDNDEVVPNLATDNEGALVQQLRGDASCGVQVAGQVPPSSAILAAAPTQSLFLNYLTVPPNTPGCTPGNTFTHGSLLSPTGRCATTTTTICNPRGAPGANGCPNNEACNSAADGTLGTTRMQTDAIFFLLKNTILPD